MSRKGYVVICDLIINGFAPMIDKVILAHDKNMQNDYYDDTFTGRINSAFLLAQFEHLDETQHRKMVLWERYNTELKSLAAFSLAAKILTITRKVFLIY